MGTEDGKVRVPAAEDMTPGTLRKHMNLRHDHRNGERITTEACSTRPGLIELHQMYHDWAGSGRGPDDGHIHEEEE